jgi:hypothetical protein
MCVLATDVFGYDNTFSLNPELKQLLSFKKAPRLGEKSPIAFFKPGFSLNSEKVV